jgi:hypothetical protein
MTYHLSIPLQENADQREGNSLTDTYFASDKKTSMPMLIRTAIIPFVSLFGFMDNIHKRMSNQKRKSRLPTIMPEVSRHCENLEASAQIFISGQQGKALLK